MNLLADTPMKADPLLPPRNAPYVVKDVFDKVVDGCRDELIFDLGDSHLRFGVDIDTDEITSQFQPAPFRSRKGYVSVRAVKPWRSCIGKKCGWTWLAANQQGYLDTALLGFDGIEPNVALQVIASSIEIYVIVRLGRAGDDALKNGKRTTKARQLRLPSSRTSSLRQ